MPVMAFCQHRLPAQGPSLLNGNLLVQTVLSLGPPSSRERVWRSLSSAVLAITHDCRLTSCVITICLPELYLTQANPSSVLGRFFSWSEEIRIACSKWAKKEVSCAFLGGRIQHLSHPEIWCKRPYQDALQVPLAKAENEWPQPAEAVPAHLWSYRIDLFRYSKNEPAWGFCGYNWKRMRPFMLSVNWAAIVKRTKKTGPLRKSLTGV